MVEANGQTVEAEGPLCSVGECCEIVDGDGERHRAEVIGFRGRHVLAMPLKATQGIRYGDAVLATGVTPGSLWGQRWRGGLSMLWVRRWMVCRRHDGGDVAARRNGATSDGA